MKILLSKWKVIRTIWPYKEGYGVYREHFITGQKTVLETGLTKEQAQAIADQQNNVTNDESNSRTG